jgi:glycosyltransferase involved in cell wall biosynthesis
MPHFDLLFSTSGYEGQSNAILEAMAAGVPVVATDIPGTRELITHEVNGFLAPVGDRANLARFANKLLDNADLARRLGDAGRQRVAVDFSIQRMIERYVALYESVLA